MNRLSSVDRNFSAGIARDGMMYTDVKAMPELICGLLLENGEWMRLPQKVAEAANPQVQALYRATAGGRLRFRTDSRTVSLRFCLGEVFASANLTNLAAAGFDVYERKEGSWQFCGAVPPGDILDKEAEGSFSFSGEGVHEVLIHFPLYAKVKELWLGVEEGSFLCPAPYRGGSFVIYGSSITQGGCASRPGNAFASIVSRWLDMDYRNVGFSAGAKGEPLMADHLAELPCDAMVIDYDHNAPNAAYLNETHEPFYRRIRAARPDLPVVFMSAPRIRLDEEWEKRRDIVRKTYENALERGERVRFVDGSAVFPGAWREECMGDQYHPGDLGMTAMADGLARALKEACAAGK